MRRSTYLIFANAIILVIVFALLAQSLFVGRRPATAVAVTGKVLVQHDGAGAFTPLNAGESIKSADTIRTGADGKVELQWADGTRLQIQPDSNLVVRKSNYIMAKKADISQFRLHYGTIFVSLAKALSPQSKFEIETPTAVASVRDAIFMMKVKNGRTQAWVREGALKLSSGEGSEGSKAHETLLRPGRMATSGAVGEVQTYLNVQTDAEFMRQ